MKFVIVFAALIAASAAALLQGASQEALATIVSQQNAISPDQSSYTYSSQTSNGISAKADATLNQPRSSDASASYAVRGQYSYQGPDGVEYTVHYIADEFGFRPTGSHLPVAPQA
ncbi:cuticle protein CP14.6-like [Sitodiplosis mosellana]|uniref:cuticle protein CP14.6-like n=1 Tax=Sitodiplosis mosellana TaxID=263140 RepID=UPI002443B992|nr:cuticle protein CP14.6-like [Sitodiplosis mosellana]